MIHRRKVLTAQDQNRLAGIFLMIHGGLQAVVMVIFGLVYGGLGAAMFLTSKREDEQFAGIAIFAVMIFIGLFALIFIIPQVIGGWKMLKERPNARTWGIIGSIISCLSFPLGTAAGVFGLVFLFGDAGRQFYLAGDRQNSFMPPTPPPNSWK